MVLFVIVLAWTIFNLNKEKTDQETTNINNTKSSNQDLISKRKYFLIGCLVCIGPILSIVSPLIKDDSGVFKLVAYLFLDLSHPFAGLILVPVIILRSNPAFKEFIVKSYSHNTA